MPKIKKIPLRSEIPSAHQWDLTLMFKDDQSWEALFGDIAGRLENYAAFKGHLTESVENLVQGLDFHMEMSRSLDHLYTYAHQKSDEDTTSSTYSGMQDRAMSLYTKASELASFFDPEIQAIDEARAVQYLAEERLAVYRFFLEKILRAKPHTLDEPVEKILAMSMEVAQAPSRIFSQLDNADLTFGVLGDEDQTQVELSHGNFISFLMNQHRDIRRQAFTQYYRTYHAHRHGIAAALSHSVKKDFFYARVRHFTSCRSAALFSDNVPESVYDNLVESVKANTEPLFRYLDFRRRALGLDELHFYDTYVPLVGEVNFQLTYDQAVETIVEALAPLGESYTDILKQGLIGGWVDRYENKGKRSGAYSSGSYDSPPYILMNFENDNINSLYTLIHESGHSMHSYLAKERQPYVNYQYTIFAAEVASTFNEVLLSRHLLDKYAADKTMTAYILNREIDNIRGTFFRQTMFAEFETLIHNDVENQRPLTVDGLTRTYCELLETHFGNALVIDPELSLECLRIPHFYHAFYVYKYATGLAAAIALANGVLAGGTAQRDAYLAFLGAGGSMFPLDALNLAGVDMDSPLPIVQTAAHFAQLVDRLIQTLEISGNDRS